MKYSKPHEFVTEAIEESNLTKQVDAAIRSENNNFIVQALLSDDAKLVKVVHRRVHLFCDMKSTLCYG
ncbi:MAG TPA: hypothetical protein EYP59_03465 [Thiotrichaceae bacterium]|nr:hypothetical protein [Thiotrichaceae bacterium]